MLHSESGRRFILLQRDGFACRFCGRRGTVVDLTILRVGPLALGDRAPDDIDGPDALLTACADCARDLPQRRMGDIDVRGVDSPSPVRGAGQLPGF